MIGAWLVIKTWGPRVLGVILAVLIWLAPGWWLRGWRDGAAIDKAIAATVKATTAHAACETARQTDSKAWRQFEVAMNTHYVELAAASASQAATFARLHAEQSARQRKLESTIADLESRPPLAGMECSEAVAEFGARFAELVGGAP